MSTQATQDANPKTVPLGIVFFTVGLIILVTVLAVWIVKPALMPQPVYLAVRQVLPHEAVDAILPTRAAVATLPENTVPLLPESPAQTEQSEEAYPDYFVSAETAVQHTTIGEPTRIIIPAINLDAPVQEIGLEQFQSNGQTYYQWQVPNGYIAGWHNNSARLGQPGNTVLNGHHNIYGEVFRDLVDLEEGDEIILEDSEQQYIYQITTTQILAERDQPMSVRIENAAWIAPTDDERITLITCWPYTDNSHRLVVVAKPIKTKS